MDCLDSAAAALFLRGELDGVRLTAVRDHLGACDSCFALVAMAVSADPWSEAQRSRADIHDNLRSWFQSSSSARGSHDESAPSAVNTPNTRIGPYVVDGVLGRGGMGVVYRAHHPETGARVAVKTVASPVLVSYEGLREEISLLTRARHESIVQIIDSSPDPRDPWYAMELLEGETLAVRNAVLWPERESAERPAVANGRLTEVLTLFARLCIPLDFVHRMGIVHCDLKPSNVFLRDRQAPVLMDFGLGMRASGAIGRESLSFSRPRGTLPYMSPEALEGRVLDARADLYALGCMLYESLTGWPPFRLESRQQLIEAQLRAVPAPVSSRVSGAPPGLDDLLSRLLAKDPRDRIGHAESVAAALASLGARSTSSLPPPAHLFRPSMVGRSEAMSSLLSCIEDARVGKGSLVIVQGESGIGKTFLASEVAQRASLRGMRVVTGQCVAAAHQEAAAEAAGGALHPFRRCFEVIRDACRAGGEGVIARLLGDGIGVLAPYFPPIADLASAESIPVPLALPEAAGRERVLEAMTRALQEFLSETPTLLVLDDLQWADELSLSVLERLAAAGLERWHALILGTQRSEEGADLLARLPPQSASKALRLARLDEGDVASMTAQMLGLAASPHALVRFVYAQSEGVPFFVAEYLRSAQVEGGLHWKDGTWHLSQPQPSESADPLARVSFPARLQELVRRRLRGVSARTARVLETAAAIGREFDVGLLSAALAWERPIIEQGLAEAAARYLVERGLQGPPRFAHDKFRETIYADLDATRRAELHRRIAAAIERQHGEDPEFHRWFAELARHLRLANEPLRALNFLEKAGNRALQIAADSEALGFLTDALDVERSLPQRYPPERRALWERGVSDALHGLGLHGEAARHLAQAAELLGHALPRGRFGLTLALAGQLLRQSFHRLLPHLARHRREGSAPRRLLEAAGGDVFERLHRTSYYTGNTFHLLLACIKSLNCYESAVQGSELAKAYANAAAVCSILPAPKLAEDYLHKAQRVLEETPDPVVETALRMVQGVYFLGTGRHAEAILYTEQGIGIAELLSFGRRRDECLTLRTAVDLYAGRVASVDRPIALLEESSRARNDAHTLAWALIQRLEAHVIRGDAAAGTQHSQRIRAVLEKSAWPEQIWGFGLGAYLAFRAGDHEEALRAARQVGDLADKAPPVHVQCVDAYDRLAETWLGLAQVRHALAIDERELRRRTSRALDTLSRAAKRFPVARPMAALHVGSVQWARGQRERALRTWNEGIAHAKAMNLEFQEARLCAAMAAALADDPPESAKAWQRSQVLLEELQLSRASLPPPELQAPT